MLVSAKQLKWVLRFYPPLFFQRIWIVKIAKDFNGLEVKISQSILNRNYNRSLFGGTIFSAADICYPVLFHQLLSHKGYKVAVWSTSTQVHYLKKITGQVKFSIAISEADLIDIESSMNNVGKLKRAYPIKIYNNEGALCVDIKCEIYIKNFDYKQSPNE